MRIYMKYTPDENRFKALSDAKIILRRCFRNSGWTCGMKKALIWLSGYLNFIAFAVIGGFVVFKSEDEELKRTAKTAFFVTLIFTVAAALQAVFSGAFSLARDYYNSGLYAFNQYFALVVTIAKIAVYATFIVLAFVSDGKSEK